MTVRFAPRPTLRSSTPTRQPVVSRHWQPLHLFDDAERRLMNLVLALGHVVLAIEVQGAVKEI
jgi:hypothetical protein